MTRMVTALGAALTAITLAATANAQTAERPLRETAFMTCADTQAMPAEERKAFVLDIADRAAKHYQTRIADNEKQGEELGWLIRSACTMAPDAYITTVVARAVRVAGGGVEPPLRQPFDMNNAVFVSCNGSKALPPEQLKELGSFIGKEAAAHYGLKPGPDWTPDYVAALVHNSCQMYPDMSYVAIIGRAIRAVATRSN